MLTFANSNKSVQVVKMPCTISEEDARGKTFVGGHGDENDEENASLNSRNWKKWTYLKFGNTKDKGFVLGETKKINKFK